MLHKKRMIQVFLQPILFFHILTSNIHFYLLFHSFSAHPSLGVKL